MRDAAQAALSECYATRRKHKPMNGPHEGYAIILEELDEMWDAIKANDIKHAKHEATQVAAICIAFIAEVNTHPTNGRSL